MNEDPRFQTSRLVQRNVGAAETERLTRGAQSLSVIIHPGQIQDFYRSFSARCGVALPTAIHQLLDFVERRCNPEARARDPEMHDMLETWKSPGAMDAIYLNACVEQYSRDKPWAQTNSDQRERSISLARFQKKFAEGSSTGLGDKAKEVGLTICLAAGLAFATDSTQLAEKLPHWLTHSLTEAATSGAETLSMLQGFSAHNLASMAIGVGAATAIVLGKAALSASWTAANEQRKRVSVSHELPRSLAILERDHAWEPHVLSVPELARGLHVKQTPPVWAKDAFEILGDNRLAIQSHVARVASELKDTWALLTEAQRASAKDMPADEAISIATTAIVAMRDGARLKGYGSPDYASLSLDDRKRMVQGVFERHQSQLARLHVRVEAIDPAGVKDKLLARRPSPAVIALGGKLSPSS